MATDPQTRSTTQPAKDRQANRPDRQEGPMCATNMRLNAAIGIVVTALGVALIYFGWRYFAG